MGADVRIFFVVALYFTSMPTVNPPLVKDLLTNLLFPQPIMQEQFMMRRDGISFEASTSGYGKISGSGSIHLSNMRLVFHCTKPGKPKEFVSYDLPLSEIANPSFKQPIFGANYLEGSTTLQGDKWKITFYQGGCGTFLRVLNELLSVIAQSLATQRRGSHVAASYTPAACNVGYMDPTDPSIIYVQQPVPASAPPPLAE